MKVLIFVAIALVALIGLVVTVGLFLPERHTASRSIVVRSAPAEVYRVIRDVASAPSWRKDLTRVEVVSATRFREHAGGDAVTYDVVEDVPGRRVVTRIAAQNLPYGGSWTYELEPVEGGTRLTITENGEVYNPIFRFVSRFIIGHTATIDRYLSALQSRLGM